MKTFIYIAALLMAVAVTPVASAGKRSMPEFEAAGTIDRLDLKSGEIVVGDIFYRLGQNLIIHDEKGRLGGRKLLSEGVKIGISPTSAGASRSQTIYEVWVLPKDYDLDAIDDD